MDDFLETLKLRAAEAQKKFMAAQQKFQIAQAEFQAAAQEHNNWQGVIAAETRKINGPLTPQEQAVVNAAPVINTKPEINKTELVRELLRQHPAGMKPGDLWKELKSQLDNRAYVYSILKRLKDKDEIRVSRGKYCFKQSHHLEDGRNSNTIVQ